MGDFLDLIVERSKILNGITELILVDRGYRPSEEEQQISRCLQIPLESLRVGFKLPFEYLFQEEDVFEFCQGSYGCSIQGQYHMTDGYVSLRVLRDNQVIFDFSQETIQSMQEIDYYLHQSRN
jgi:hypothetical protein